MSDADIQKAGERLAEGWARYVAAFGIPPRGTPKQMAALLELSQAREWIKESAKVESGE